MSDAAKDSPAGFRHQDKGHQRKGCVDCARRAAEEGVRPPRRKAPYPGPRCASCHRLKKAERKNVTRERRWMMVYNLTAEQHAAVLAAQNGKCAICQRSNGRSRALSIDHDHACCDGPTSCGNCTRGILCRPCNSWLGWIRDSVEAAQRTVDYLINPVGRDILDNWENEYSHGRWKEIFLDEEPEY